MPPTSRRSPLVRHPRTQYPLTDIEHGREILTLLASLRFATGMQLQRAVFAREATSERQARYSSTRALRRLFDAGLIRRVPVFAPSAASGRLSRQIVQVLSPAGARAIGFDPRLSRTRSPKERTVLAHDFWLVELAVMALEGVPAPLTITHWWNDRVLSGRKRKGLLSLPTIPDALLVVRHRQTGKEYPCLVELDLGTESVMSTARRRADFARKIEGYLPYLGAPFRTEFGIDAPPIVLIVAESERRLASLRATTQRLGGGGRFWFATLPRLRGISQSDRRVIAPSAGLHAPFWAQSWQRAQDDGWRSLAARCGV
ncbi:MAG: replication-relaxation family protein [Thermomicrobiales bacterium]